jgi:glycosyltransferase involved in cell wall biosynthesis
LTLGFSIIICAFNAAPRLGKTLEHLSKLKIPEGLPVELIVVNNGSTDDTKPRAKTIWEDAGNPFDLVVIDEMTPGLSNARRRGVLNARYQFGVFCDDDNWLDPCYLIEALNIFSKNVRVGVIGGCSTPVSDVPFPSWFYTKCGAFAVGTQSDVDGEITWRKFVWGAGLCFRTEIARQIYNLGINHQVADRTGKTLTSGGDGEFCAWYIFAGYNLYYTRALAFQHYMPPDRLSDEYYDRFFNLEYPTLWRTYSHYLTVKYALVRTREGAVGLAHSVVARFLSCLALARDWRSAMSVVSTERKIQRLLTQGSHKLP